MLSGIGGGALHPLDIESALSQDSCCGGAGCTFRHLQTHADTFMCKYVCKHTQTRINTRTYRRTQGHSCTLTDIHTHACMKLQPAGVSINTRRAWPWDRYVHKYLWLYKCTAQPYVSKAFGVSARHMCSVVHEQGVWGGCAPRARWWPASACSKYGHKHGEAGPARACGCAPASAPCPPPRAPTPLQQAILVLTSLCILWGEVTIPLRSPDLSPFSHMIRDMDHPNQFSIQIVTLLPLVGGGLRAHMLFDWHAAAAAGWLAARTRAVRLARCCRWWVVFIYRSSFSMDIPDVTDVHREG